MLTKIEIVRGTTNTFNIGILDAEGKPYTLAGAEKLIFGVKCNPLEPETVILKVAEADNVGGYIVTLNPEDTIDLKCDKYFYDVGLESGDAFYNVIEPSPFVILPNITKRGDA